MPRGRQRVDPDRLSREFLRKQCTTSALRPTRCCHGSRSTVFAAPGRRLHCTEGIDIQIVSERLNHSSTHVTREICTQVTPPMQNDAAERVALRFFGGERR